jgi:hypothetical protein
MPADAPIQVDRTAAAVKVFQWRCNISGGA